MVLALWACQLSSSYWEHNGLHMWDVLYSNVTEDSFKEIDYRCPCYVGFPNIA